VWQIIERADSAPQRCDDALELLAVLAEVDRLDVRADQGAVVLLENPVVVHGDCAVEGCLAPERREHRVGALLGDDGLDDLGCDRLHVGRVGELGSVMIVAGLLLTRMTRMPSSRSTRQAWVPE
jgi:hypothetical protein